MSRCGYCSLLIPYPCPFLPLTTHFYFGDKDLVFSVGKGKGVFVSLHNTQLGF